jgi:hypothetical protein
MNHANCGHREIDGIESEIVEVWPAGECFISTLDLVESLMGHNPDKWGRSCCYRKGLTPQRMGRYLFHELGIKASKNAHDKRGYYLADFTEAAA